MEVFSALAKQPVFSIKEVEAMTGNLNTAYSKLNRLMKKGVVKKIRKNIYSVVNPASGQIVATRYQIACAITPTAYISHHSAFEYYGLANQVFNEVYVSSDTKFKSFECEGMVYKHVASRINDGIIPAKNTTLVKITDLERTVIDSINDLDKIAGLEELLKCLEGMYYLQADKLHQYLDAYNVQALFQKTGFILQHYQSSLQLPDSFFDYCKGKITASVRYLSSVSRADNIFNPAWQLMVPGGFFEMMEQGDDDYA